jgi:hypothetical protein
LRRLAGRHASGSLISVGRGGISPKEGDLRDSASEEQMGAFAGTPTLQHSPGGTSTWHTAQSSQPVPILPSSCSAVSCFRMAMDGRSRGPEARSLFVSRESGSLSRNGSIPVLRRSSENFRSVSDFSSLCSTEGADEGFWGAGSGRGRGSETSLQFWPRERSVDDSTMVAEDTPSAMAEGEAEASPLWMSLRKASAQQQLATWAEAGPTQSSEWAVLMDAGVSLLGEERPSPPVSSLSLLLRRAYSSTPDAPAPPGLLWGSLDGSRSEGNRHSDTGEQFFRLPADAQLAKSPSMPQFSKHAEELLVSTPDDRAAAFGTPPSVVLLGSPPSALAGSSTLRRTASGGLGPRSPAIRVSSTESLSACSLDSVCPLGRLLYVEDHHLIRVLVSRVLEKSGFKVCFVRN